MEELKVRAKNLGEWVEGYFCVYRGIPQILVDESSWEPIDDIKTVGRYTGLCDKNGNKIFEGDILKNEYEKNKYQYFKVFYCSRTYCWLVENKYGMLGKLYNVIGDIEIIGNIHDNSEELLKGSVDNG